MESAPVMFISRESTTSSVVSLTIDEGKRCQVSSRGVSEPRTDRRRGQKKEKKSSLFVSCYMLMGHKYNGGQRLKEGEDEEMSCQLMQTANVADTCADR